MRYKEQFISESLMRKYVLDNIKLASLYQQDLKLTQNQRIDLANMILSFELGKDFVILPEDVVELATQKISYAELEKEFKLSFDRLIINFIETVKQPADIGGQIFKWEGEKFVAHENHKTELNIIGFIFDKDMDENNQEIIIITTIIKEPFGYIKRTLSMILKDTKENKPIELYWLLALKCVLFLNSRNVSYVPYNGGTKTNLERERQGKPPLPVDFHWIRIEKTKEIQDHIASGKRRLHSGFNYQFDVRGHWRRFLSPRYTNKRGTKVWIEPHKKGCGLYIPARYLLESKEAKGNE